MSLRTHWVTPARPRAHRAGSPARLNPCEEVRERHVANLDAADAPAPAPCSAWAHRPRGEAPGTAPHVRCLGSAAPDTRVAAGRGPGRESDMSHRTARSPGPERAGSSPAATRIHPRSVKLGEENSPYERGPEAGRCRRCCRVCPARDSAMTRGSQEQGLGRGSRPD